MFEALPAVVCHAVATVLSGRLDMAVNQVRSNNFLQQPSLHALQGEKAFQKQLGVNVG